MSPVRIAMLAAGLLFLAGCSGDTSPSTPTSTTTSTATTQTPTASRSATAQGLRLRGTLLEDRLKHGCPGDQVDVRVLDASGVVVGSQLVNSYLLGVDCTFSFEVAVPKLDCYALVIDGTPVGQYPFAILKDGSGTVGIINGESVYGNATAPPRVLDDFNGCEMRTAGG